MKTTHIIAFLLVLLTISCGRKTTTEPTNENKEPVESDCIKFNGRTYEYLQKGEAEDWRFTMQFKCVNDTLKGVMLGPFLTGESVMYFKADLVDIKISENKIQFLADCPFLFKKPFDLNNYKTLKNDTTGWGDFDFSYKGSFTNESLTISCSPTNKEDFNYCYADTLFFTKK